MKIRELSDDVIEATDSSTEETVGLLQAFKPNECWQLQFKNTLNTKSMTDYVEKLHEYGLDIGKGNSSFGYKMPLVDKDASYRILQIFRRQ